MNKDHRTTTDARPEGYAFTTLHQIATFDVRERFEAFRKLRGLPVYFHDAEYGENLPNKSSFLVDDADLHDIERAFLAGADVHRIEGMRLPWSEKSGISKLTSPDYQVVNNNFSRYTIWPSTHALIGVDFRLLRFVANFLARLELPILDLPAGVTSTSLPDDEDWEGTHGTI